MEELLFLAHRIPYPPNKGDKVRSYNLIRRLARSYKVHLGTFIDDPQDWRHVEELQKLCGESHFAPLISWRAKLSSVSALLTKSPLSLPYYSDRHLRLWVQRMLVTRPIRKVMVYSGTMAQYVQGASYRHLRRIVDFVDVDSEKWRQYSTYYRGLRAWIYAREGRTLFNYENRIAAEFDASVFVSAEEAGLFKRLAPETAERIWDVQNGVDGAFFDPVHAYPNPYASSEKVSVFTGAMDYWANADAAKWYCEHVFPLVHARDPDACCYIVGARPTASVRRLARRPGVRVTGTVQDVRPYLAHARVAVAPLRIARGVQNKVLEAMAMAKPVVATPQALEGISCQIDVEVLQAGTAADYADKVSACLDGHFDYLSQAARARVLQDYNWDINLDRFEHLLNGVWAAEGAEFVSSCAGAHSS